MGDDSKINNLKETLSERAVLIGKSWGFTLDYSEESVKQVSEVLNEYNNQYQSNKSEIGLNEIALDFGAYLIKCLEQLFGEGKLDLNHPEYGPNTLPFSIKGFTIFPYLWCMKNLYGGDTENVWFKYHAFVDDAQKK